jgi:hypothetical protein
LPWILIDTFGFFKNYKIQSVSPIYSSDQYLSPLIRPE